ncbi:hypothetical protein Lal_00033098 [Lupinus albus]|nr:hypothetical protein Lal_00033098 [Lupinus albus]
MSFTGNREVKIVQKSVWQKQIFEMEEEMNRNNETYCQAEGLDEFNGSEDENVNEVEELNFEEINFQLLNEDDVKKYRFLNNDIAYKFYKMYGMKKGFGIRKYHTRRNKDGEIIWQSFFCDREGFRDKKMNWFGRGRREKRLDVVV